MTFTIENNDFSQYTRFQDFSLKPLGMNPTPHAFENYFKTKPLQKLMILNWGIRTKFLFLFLSLFFITSLSADTTTELAQQVLSRLGYYHGNIDGSMGSATSAAIRRFQVANHLRPTGTLTSETTETLGVQPAKHISHTVMQPPYVPASNYPDPKALADLFVGGPLLAASPEIQVATVQRAQKNLCTLGYFHGPINGIPDANLKAALIAYQKDSKFKASGRLDKITLMGLDILPGSYQAGQ
ncbi:MAG: peptidoglycan-binding protein [Chthoniobacterales bacterium]